jgi:hypothetical protein
MGYNMAFVQGAGEWEIDMLLYFKLFIFLQAC